MHHVMQKRVFAAVTALLALCALAAIAMNGDSQAEHPLALDEVGSLEASAMHSLDSQLDASLLHQKNAPKPAHMLTRSVHKWAEAQHRKNMAAAVQSAKGSVSTLEQQKEGLEAKLATMLSQKVHNTAATFAKVAEAQRAIKARTNAQLLKGLTQNQIQSMASKPYVSPLEAHNGALTQDVNPQNTDDLDRELDQKIRHNLALESRLPMPKSALAAAAAAPAAAAPAAPAAASAAASGNTRYVWDSPPSKDYQAYTAWRQSAIPAMHNVIKDGQNRIYAHLKERLRRLRHKHRVYRRHFRRTGRSPLHRAVVGDSYGPDPVADQMKQHKYEWDLVDEEKQIDRLYRDMNDKMVEERRYQNELRENEIDNNYASVHVANLNREIQEDQRDLMVAENNAERLKDHLPQYYEKRYA